MRVEHGTGRYGSKHCKCDDCKATRARYYREWYAKHGRKKRAEVAEQRRGSLQS